MDQQQVSGGIISISSTNQHLHDISNYSNSMDEKNPNSYHRHHDSTNETIDQKQQQIHLTNMRHETKKLADFYANKNILITGVTGFIGKVCLAQLIGSLGNCGQVFVMLRSKKGVSSQQRFNKMIKEKPFIAPQLSNGNSNKGNYKSPSDVIDWSKVVPVDGDMSCEDLGFSEEIKTILCNKVEIMFNIAASVQFDAPLKQNLRDNYMGSKNLLNLATKFEQLISLIHVSTFYSNSHISHVEEKVLPMDRDCEQLAEFISWIPDSLCDTIAPQIMENRPNTYIFTKAMSENLIQKYQGRLPIAIVRPSIVTPAVKDPIPGWVDNVNGPMGLGLLGSIGILRNMTWNYYGISDMIPVDFVVNTMLAVAERTPRLYKNEIKVYNCSTSSLNPIRWGEGFEILREESMKAPPYKMLRMPIKVPRHKKINPLEFKLSKLSELLFAYFIDFILMICGQKQILTKLTAKLHHGYQILEFFTSTEFTCSNENILSAFDELHPDDKSQFNFDIRALNWHETIKESYYGTRQFLLKEDISNVPAALFKMKILMVVEFMFKMMFYSLIGWNFYKLYKYISH